MGSNLPQLRLKRLEIHRELLLAVRRYLCQQNFLTVQANHSVRGTEADSPPDIVKRDAIRKSADFSDVADRVR